MVSKEQMNEQFISLSIEDFQSMSTIRLLDNAKILSIYQIVINLLKEVGVDMKANVDVYAIAKKMELDISYEPLYHIDNVIGILKKEIKEEDIRPVNKIIINTNYNYKEKQNNMTIIPSYNFAIAYLIGVYVLGHLNAYQPYALYKQQIVNYFQFYYDNNDYNNNNYNNYDNDKANDDDKYNSKNGTRKNNSHIATDIQIYAESYFFAAQLLINRECFLKEYQEHFEHKASINTMIKYLAEKFCIPWEVMATYLIWNNSIE